MNDTSVNDSSQTGTWLHRFGIFASILVTLITLVSAVLWLTDTKQETVIEFLFENGASLAVGIGFLAAIPISYFGGRMRGRAGLGHVLEAGVCILKEVCGSSSTHDKINDDVRDARMEEMRITSTLITEGKAEEMTATAYSDRAASYLENEEWSRHVLYATNDSATDFYLENGENSNHLEKEQAETKQNRKRLMIIQDSELGDPAYRAKTLRIYKKVCDTSIVKIIRDRDLIDSNFANIIRDCGLFSLNSHLSHEKHVLFTFAPFDLMNMFALLPGRQYLSRDSNYFDRLNIMFENVWNSTTLAAEFNLQKDNYTKAISASVESPVNAAPNDVKWKSNEEYALTRQHLTALMKNEIPAIRIKGFATDDECNLFLQAASAFESDTYDNVTPRIEKQGRTQFEGRFIGKEEYFSDATLFDKQLSEIFANSFDPRGRMLDMLFGLGESNINVAVEPDGSKYLVGLIRVINDGTLIHTDDSHKESSNWSVGEVSEQIVWNLFLSAPESGGECIIYEREWIGCDEICSLSGPYGYDSKLVAGINHISLTPNVGDVTIFNCRNYHEVKPCQGQRTTFGSFIGRQDDGSLILWS